MKQYYFSILVSLLLLIPIGSNAQGILEPVTGAVIGKITTVNTSQSSYNVIGFEYGVAIDYLMSGSSEESEQLSVVSKIVADYVGNYHQLPPDPRADGKPLPTFVRLPKEVVLPDVTEQDIVVLHDNFVWIFSNEAKIKYALVSTTKTMEILTTLIAGTAKRSECNGELCLEALIFIDDEKIMLKENERYESRNRIIDSIMVFNLELSVRPNEPDTIGYLVRFHNEEPKISSFIDVASNHPYFDSIEYAKEQNIIEGYEDRTFRPDAHINRAELIKMLVATQGNVETLQTCIAVRNQLVAFPDLQLGAWYSPYICTAKLLEWINGYDDGTFRPDQKISIAELSKILANAYGITTENVPDVDWYIPYYRALSSRNAIPISIQSYDQYVTRGELAFMIESLQ